MNLQTLLQNLPLSSHKSNPHSEIAYVWQDSREIKKADLFVLCDSFFSQAESFLQSAFQNGAIGVVVSRGLMDKLSHLKIWDSFETILLSSVDAEQFTGRLAHKLAGNPSESLHIVAVTGTNGKTSMTQILSQMAEISGIPFGIIGTIEVRYADKVFPSLNTTPDASRLNLLLKDMKECGIQLVFLEASSHGLKLGRMNGLSLRAGVFTNLTPDHLDFHLDMNDYLLSKFQLFELLERSFHKDAFGLVSLDSSGSPDIVKLYLEKKLSRPMFAMGKGQKFSFQNPKLSIQGTQFEFLDEVSQPVLISSRLLGEFNLFNLSLALSVWVLLHSDQVLDLPGLAGQLKPIPGRFQVIGFPLQDRIAVVDYAHTPDALESILKSCLELNPSQIITVFGCGGDRDRTKRPVMGRIASQSSDLAILTSDNPRTEDPERILDEVESGILELGKGNSLRITDRKKAIEEGVRRLQPGGILLVAGKGHEDYQIIGKTKIHFSDVEEIKKSFVF